MIHNFVGSVGHLSVILVFISAFACVYSYYQSEIKKDRSWEKFSNYVFYFHAVATISVIVSLFVIINKHFFEYHYAWSHTSKVLPVHYQISSFWEGQEGSFLLWLFWNSLLGIIIIISNRFWLSSVMTIISLVQLFLASMILGVVFFDFKLGSSPFMLLREVIDAPIFRINPDFVPKDGNGLNPLLQNYWMVIHPPTLFLGFATTVIPFSYCIAGLWKNRLSDWIRPALPWAQFSALVLGIGILMGAYWAYETLNFGGYWNWDPVENAVYVPWLVLVASIHTMIAYKKNKTALKASIILSLSTFILILYSTFLTRSGVLGDSSVHSFTDLGLSGQLLIYLFAFIILSVVLTVHRWKHLRSNAEVSVYSREFWIFMGATTLCLMAFQVIIPTSIPVYNRIIEFFGGISDLAPPVDQIEFYSRFQIWFAVLLAIFSGIGQFFWWKKIDPKSLKEALLGPVVLALLAASIVLLIGGLDNLSYSLLISAAIFSIIANGKILWKLSKTNLKLSGGSITHIGVSLMLIGIIFSSGYAKIISKNNTGLIWSNDFPDEVNRDNLLLFLKEPRDMGGYSLLYTGLFKKVKGYAEYVKENALKPISRTKSIIKEAVAKGGESVFNLGDTVELVNPENSYFQVKFLQEGEEKFTLYPRVQINETMDMVVYSPDIKRKLRADLYTHVRNFPDPEQGEDWSDLEEMNVGLGEEFFANDFVSVLESVERISDVEGMDISENDVAVKAKIKVKGSDQDYLAEPTFIIRDRKIGRIPDTIEDLAVKFTLMNINPQENNFTIGINTTQKDWIIIEAVEKPLINILWLGTFFLVIGFFVAVKRRFDEFKKMRDKNLE